MEFEYDKDGRIAKRRAPGKLEGSFYHDIKQVLIERFQAAADWRGVRSNFTTQLSAPL
jgi:hypothetical protein